jgi:hypothetical protein
VNAYPEYDDVPTATPPATPSYPPAAPWALTSVTATGQTDETSARGFWYYVVFTKDACENVSAVSNVTDGTLNYHLGDVRPGSGNNQVTTVDMSALGAAYGATLVFNDPDNDLDVGPTSDFSVDALPDTDDEVEFEDLMMFAINFGQVTRDAPGAPEEIVFETPSLALVVDATDHAGRLTARLILDDNVEAVKGIHSVVSFDRERLELIEVRQGELLDGQGPVFFANLDHEEGAVVDAAVMGRGRTVSGSGEVAELHFRVLMPGARPGLVEADLRNRSNGSVGRRTEGGIEVAGADRSSPEVTGVPTRIELVGARPNPFGASTEIVFRLPQATAVSLDIYDVSGRLVRTLIDRVVAPGEVRAAWDGRTNDGQLANAGVYFYVFQAAEQKETRKLIRFR